MFAWAVRPGQSVVAAVPEPEMVAMLLAGLGVLGFTARRSRNRMA
ncbi:MAG: PEP-CTERM sorting domain-containing protein [Nitrosomonadales bacterium]|nr:PEP-CTERM sorting domain-containing protein [Nitrosomonadales bacterium]